MRLDRRFVRIPPGETQADTRIEPQAPCSSRQAGFIAKGLPRRRFRRKNDFRSGFRLAQRFFPS